MLNNNFRRLLGLLVVLSAGFSVVFSLIQASKADAPGNLTNLARERIAQMTRRPISRLSVVNSSEITYEIQNLTAFEFKVMDNESGEIYGITLNRSGQELNSAQLQTNEQAAYVAQYGKLDPELAQKITTYPANKPIRVTIWLKEPSSTSVQSSNPSHSSLTSAEQINAFFTQVKTQRSATVRFIVAPVVNRLRNVGNNVRSDEYAPVVYITLTPGRIRQVGEWDEVSQVYEDKIAQPELDVARSTISANTVHQLGFTGTGVKVAQIEAGGRIATTNPYLSGVIQDTAQVCSSVSNHSTRVAGIIRSTHATVRGIAPGVNLWAGGSCSGSASDLESRSTAAVNWGSRVLNLSWGTSNTTLRPDASDRFYDNMVFNLYRTVIKSAGNRGGAGCSAGTDGNVTSPGLGYNVITVGNFDDKNTTSWSDDLMAACSSWRDPVAAISGTTVSNVREKPDLAAPGTKIGTTTTSSPWTDGVGGGDSGTSFAAPMVTGAAALLIQANNSLAAAPQAIKAILMATAVHNIEGNQKLSEYDGAGGIVVNQAYNVARRLRGNWGASNYLCNSPTSLDVGTMSLTGNVRTRAVLTWNQSPNYTFYNTKTSADLDLQIVNSSNQAVSLGVGVFNNHEIVDFTPPTTGTYKLRVQKFRCDMSPKDIGWAWQQIN